MGLTFQAANADCLQMRWTDPAPGCHDVSVTPPPSRPRTCSGLVGTFSLVGTPATQVFTFGMASWMGPYVRTSAYLQLSVAYPIL